MALAQIIVEHQRLVILRLLSEVSGLVTLEKLGSTYIATLTGRGEDVAAGRSMVSGIKKPRPGE